jgi:hypothetical protein
VAARLHDEAARASLLAELATMTRDTVLLADLSNGIRSEFAFVRGDPLGGIPLPGPIRAAVRVEHAVRSGFISQPARRHMQASLLAAHGQDREALDWFESLATFSLLDLPYGVPALVDRARLHERMGDYGQAAALYRRFLGLWKDHDPEFQYLVDAAHAGLRRLPSSVVTAADHHP